VAPKKRNGKVELPPAVRGGISTFSKHIAPFAVHQHCNNMAGPEPAAQQPV
jgi:hypothetical protein